MQTYTRITNEFTGAELPGKIDENLQSLKSDFSGTAFPTANLVEGMTCYRTDLDTEYRYVGGAWEVSGIATQAQAEEGVDNTKVMTPKGVDYRLNKDRSLKTYTSFEQLGLSSTATLLDVVTAMPKESQFAQYIGVNTYEAFGVPQPGIVTIVKAQGNNYANLMHQSYGGSNSTRKAWFENWASGQTQFLWHEILSENMFATQSQAEAGTDNATVMTPLQTKNAIDAHRPLKTFTSFEQLGFTNAPTVEQIVEVMPVHSKLVLFITSDNVSAFGVPDAGVLEITKGKFIDYATLILNRYGGDDIPRKMWYENWARGQTSFNWQEVITYDNNGNTARTNLNLRLQTFTSLEQLGLDYTATPERIAKALPENSEISFYAQNAMKPTLGHPINGSCRIEKRSTAGYSTVNFFLYSQTTNTWYYGVYSSYNNIGFSGWRKMSGSSLPSVAVSGISISAATVTGDGYTAPANGWLIVAYTPTTSSNGNWLRIYNTSRELLSVSSSSLGEHTGRLMFPMLKGHKAKVSRGSNSPMNSITFYYADSEV